MHAGASLARALALVFGLEGRFAHVVDRRGQFEASLGVGYDVINDPGDLVAAYAGAPGQSFVAAGAGHSPWLFRAGLGYVWQMDTGADVAIRLDAEGRAGYLNQSASVKGRWRF